MPVFASIPTAKSPPLNDGWARLVVNTLDVLI